MLFLVICQYEFIFYHPLRLTPETPPLKGGDEKWNKKPLPEVSREAVAAGW